MDLYSRGSAHFRPTFAEPARVYSHHCNRAVFVERVVCASEGQAAVLHLEVAARVEIFEGFGEYGMHGFEAVHQGAAMDVVEGLTIDPIVLCIVDLELAIRRYVIGLNG